MSQTPQEVLKGAISFLGGTAKTAEKLKISPQAVSQWDVCPVGRVLQLEALTGISRHLLRPDIYPSPTGDSPLVASQTDVRPSDQLGQAESEPVVQLGDASEAA